MTQTPGRGALKEQRAAVLVKKFPVFYGIRTVCYKNPPLDPIFWKRWMQFTPSHLIFLRSV